jgi:hypothetical protein
MRNWRGELDWPIHGYRVRGLEPFVAVTCGPRFAKDGQPYICVVNLLNRKESYLTFNLG